MLSEVLLMGMNTRGFSTSLPHDLASVESESDNDATFTGNLLLLRSCACGGAISNSRREERNFAWVVQSSMGSGLLSGNSICAASGGPVAVQMAAITELVLGRSERCDAVWVQLLPVWELFQLERGLLDVEW